MLNYKEYERWIKAAGDALRSAVLDLEHGFYNWACFKAEQAAQMALKALLHLTGNPAWGHDLVGLYRTASNLVESEDAEIHECCAMLGKMYITARYPDALPGGTPAEYFTENEARKAVECGEKILRWVRDAANSLREEAESKAC